MKNILVFLTLTILNFTYFSLNAQSITVKINKTEFDINEIISLKYTVDVAIDSVTHKKFKGFTIHKENTAINRYLANGKKGIKYMSFFKLKPVKPGVYKIYSPSFNYKGKILKAKSIQIKVFGKKTIKKEAKSIELVEKPK